MELEGVEGLEQGLLAQDRLDADAGGVLLAGLEEVGDLPAELLELNNRRVFFWFCESRREEVVREAW